MEKVKKGIKACWSEYFSHKCYDCPYKDIRDEHGCVKRLGEDAISLLKEQEEKDEKILTALDGYRMCDEMSKNAYDNLTRLIKSEQGKWNEWIEITNDKTCEYNLKCPSCGYCYSPNASQDGTISPSEIHRFCPKCGKELADPAKDKRW